MLDSLETSSSLRLYVPVALFILFVVYNFAAKRRLPHPPGPRGYPLLGYLQGVERPAWKTYQRWSQEYGSDAVRFNTLGTNVVVANTLDAATDLLEKRSSIYSDRPAFGITMLRDLVGFDWNLGVSRYNAFWRESRKLFHQEFNLHAVEKYRPVQMDATRQLLRDLLQDPSEFRDHVRFLAGREIMEIAYGLKVREKTDPHVAAANQGIWIASQCMTPGSYLVDLIPILKYVPEWVPGAGFKRQAREWKQVITSILEDPFHAMKALGNVAPDCAASSMLEKTSEQRDNPEFMERVVKGTLATMFAAGADTTTSSLYTFFLAMTLNPDVQDKAQRSIDHVCHGRLPYFSDYDSLPYVHAIVKECLRWKPVAQLNFAHMSTQDDVYKGYFIRAGSLVLANSAAILHDPYAYTDPEDFNPERFLRPRQGSGGYLDLELNPDVRDPMVAAFGFGRRICPGRFMAYESMWIVIASVLATFTVSKASDSRGCPITPKGDYADGFLSVLLPFECQIRPRSQVHVELIRDG